MLNLNERFHLSFAAAFARGYVPDLASLDDEEAFCGGVDAGLTMQDFERMPASPQLRRVFAMLSELEPQGLLDVQSGRGTLLWHLLEVFDAIPVTSVAADEQRASDLEAVSRGGIANLTVRQMDPISLGFGARSFDGVAMLETLALVTQPELAVREALRVARRFVIASLPPPPEDPSGGSGFDAAEEIAEQFTSAGAHSVRIEQVHRDRIVLALICEA